MRRSSDRGRVQRLLLQAQEPLRQAVELGAGLLHHLPLFRQLIGQLLYHLRLMRGRLLERDDPFFGFRRHIDLSFQPFLGPKST